MRKFLLIFYLFSCTLFSQEKWSLKQVLNQLIKTHQIDFSYSEKQVQKFKNISFNSGNNLNDVLLQLSVQTQLVFEKIDGNNYIVRKQNKQTKTICGVVLSQKNNEILPFANVYFQHKNVLANKDGEFKIKDALVDDIITVKLLGYNPVNISVKDFNKGTCKQIFLTEAIHQLSEVLITDYLTTGFTKKKEGCVVLDPKKTGILPGVIEPDVLQSLQLIPGVQSPDETTSGIHIRGSTPDQNLVVFDGMKMYHFSHYFGLISAFNPYITNNIKLYRSGTHAKYGNNVGGVLDISTDNYVPNKLSVGLGTTLTHSDFFIKTPLLKNKVGFVFSARRSITDVVNTITNQEYTNVAFQNSKISDGLDEDNLKITNGDTDFFYEDYHAKIIVEPKEGNKLSLSYLYNLNDLSFKGNNLKEKIDFNDDIDIKNTGIHLDWEFGTTPKGVHKIALTNTNFIKGYTGTISGYNNDNDNVSFQKSNQVKESGLAYGFTKQTKNFNKWELGYQLNFNNVNYNFVRSNSVQGGAIDDKILGKAINSAVFSEYQLNYKFKWLVNLGLRWQYFAGIDGHYLEPRLNVNYKYNKHLNFKISTELKHQSIAQVLDFRADGLGGLFDQFWALANKQVFPVLQSFQTSFGLDYQKQGWVLDVEFYQKNINGVLFLFDEDLKSEKYFKGTNNVLGADFLIKKQWNNYSSWISYSLSKSLYKFNNLNAGKDFDGSYDAPHNFIWSHAYNYRQFEFSLGWRFRSGIPYTIKTLEENQNNPPKLVFEDLNTERLPNYQRLDFSTRYKFYIGKNKKTKAQIGLTLQNILNKTNILSRDYEIQTEIVGQGPNRKEEQVLVQTDRISLGFVPNVMFRVNF